MPNRPLLLVVALPLSFVSGLNQLKKKKEEKEIGIMFEILLAYQLKFSLNLFMRDNVVPGPVTVLTSELSNRHHNPGHL